MLDDLSVHIRAAMRYPDDYCLQDSAGYGACIREMYHFGKHRDANGYEYE